MVRHPIQGRCRLVWPEFRDGCPPWLAARPHRRPAACGIRARGDGESPGLHAGRPSLRGRGQPVSPGVSTTRYGAGLCYPMPAVPRTQSRSLRRVVDVARVLEATTPPWGPSTAPRESQWPTSGSTRMHRSLSTAPAQYVRAAGRKSGWPLAYGPSGLRSGPITAGPLRTTAGPAPIVRRSQLGKCAGCCHTQARATQTALRRRSGSRRSPVRVQAPKMRHILPESRAKDRQGRATGRHQCATPSRLQLRAATTPT